MRSSQTYTKVKTHFPLPLMRVCETEESLAFADPNHKPEMALAITSFAALCGFLPLPRIVTYLNKVPELATLVPQAVLDNFLRVVPTTDPSAPVVKQALRDVFSAIMTAPADTFTAQLARLIKRYESLSSVHAEEEGVRKLVLRLNTQFPNDIGIFCSFLLNYVELSPGEAIFLGAGEPHAYVSGGQHPHLSPMLLHADVNHEHDIL
jgi:mannose-6-phosphate isomerase